MSFKRQLYSSLQEWKSSSAKKPLILRGARQVGKTTLVREFSKEFKHHIWLNLEKDEHKAYFTQYTDVSSIVEALFFGHGISIEDINKTLLFIDEIQELPKAIQLLRYFYEELPDLHVISAGSLLEFAMAKVPSFPVGRVEFRYLHPLNFQEYLLAKGNDLALEQLKQTPIKEFAHNTLIDLFHEYAIIGGMPEVVKTYLSSGSISNISAVYESIWATYKNDVEKYGENDTEQKVIKHIISSAHLFLDKRVKFQHFGNSNYKSREVGEAFRNLDSAKVIQLIYPTTVNVPPIIPDLKKSPKLQFLDTGLVVNELSLQTELMKLSDFSESFKGALIPHLITQELISLNNSKATKPCFWVREKRQSQSELDLVYHYENKLIPIEIKSGKAGTLRSLHQYIEQTNHNYAVRIYGGKFSIEKHKTINGKEFHLMNLPYYLGTQIPNYIKYLVEEIKPV